MRFGKFQLIWMTGKFFKQPELKYARLGVPYCTYTIIDTLFLNQKTHKYVQYGRGAHIEVLFKLLYITLKFIVYCG